MTNDDFALREELRRLEAEKDRLEKDVVAPSWERERIVGLEARIVRMQESLARIEARIGEISLAQELAMSALTKVEAMERRLADDGR